MCGIGGVWGARPLGEPERLAQVFCEALAHRGPDGEGYLGIPVIDETIVGRSPEVLRGRSVVGMLIHRRLSIIDLTTGDQPMALPSDRLWIVYNGEIYNYVELRRELAAVESEPFRTTSDTEVILRVYRRWGIEGFRRLNGMFALALFDGRRREMILARDPVGVKPLYWVERQDGIAFASEIGPLRRAGLVTDEIAPQGLAQYLFYRFVPSPGTVWQGVRKVVPGHALRFDARGRCVSETDFAAPAPTATSLDLDSLSERFREAVQRQLVSDVPLGAFLSGGLDSSLVVAAMRVGSAGPTTFGIGFPATPDASSELPLAERASQILGASHEQLVERPDLYFSRYPQAVLQVEEPLAQPGLLLLSDLASLAKRRVKVVLTGQGADEPLGGYPRHQAARVALLLARMLGRRAWSTLSVRHEKTARFLRSLAAPPGPERAAAPFSPLTPETAGALVRGCGPEGGRAAIIGGVERWWRRSEGLDDLARILYADARTSLADDLLLMGDKTAMAHGLEARVPFLDLEYLSIVEGIPGRRRIPLWRRRKWIQHGLAKRLLPPGLARALAGSRNPFRKKLAFEVPMATWLRRGFGARLSEVLAGPKSVLPHYVDRAYLVGSVDRYLTQPHQGYRVVFALYVLELWLRATVANVSVAELPAA